jgi:hypothetical protein
MSDQPTKLPWRPIAEAADLPDDTWIIAHLGPNSVSPGAIMRCKRGMLSDRPGPNHLRIFADFFLFYDPPPGLPL